MFYTMDYCDGGSLASVIPAHGFDVEKARGILMGLVSFAEEDGWTRIINFTYCCHFHS